LDTGAEAGGGDQVRGAFDAMTDDAGGGDQVRGAFDEARADELPARTMATAARTGATMRTRERMWGETPGQVRGRVVAVARRVRSARGDAIGRPWPVGIVIRPRLERVLRPP